MSFLDFLGGEWETNNMLLLNESTVTRSANMKGKLAMHPSSTAWQKHVRGLASVIEARGPQGFQSPSSLELVSLLRMLVVSTLRPLDQP